MNDPVVDLTFALANRHDADQERSRTLAGLKHAATAQGVTNALTWVARTDDVGVILDAELAALQFDLDHRVNSRGMQASLTTAIGDLKIARVTLELVRCPDDYATVNRAYLRDHSRVGPLPRDEARQFFRSHYARLLNQDKTGLDCREKRILDYRRGNLTRAERLYKGLQRRALGIPEKSPREAGRRP